LFTVLGEVASDRAGAGLRWRAAPRLDVVADLGVRAVSDEVAADAFARATLRLDDRGRGAIVFEARRAGAIDGGWTGARVAGRVPVGRWSAALEAELVRPDVDRGRGTLWPWALAALGWTAGRVGRRAGDRGDLVADRSRAGRRAGPARAALGAPMRRPIVIAVVAVAIVACAGVLGLRKTERAGVRAPRARRDGRASAVRAATPASRRRAMTPRCTSPTTPRARPPAATRNPHDQAPCASCHSDPFMVWPGDRGQAPT
jgi:hypothetical protein